MQKGLRVGFTLALILVSSACTGPLSVEKTDTDQIKVAFSVKKFLKADAVLSADEAGLVDALERGDRVSHRLITKLLLEQHKNDFATRHSLPDTELAATKLSDVVAGAGTDSDRHQFKLGLESSLDAKLALAALTLKYNKASVNVLDVVTNGRLQCYSGTALYQIARRTALAGHQFRDEANLVFFSSGHIFSGYRRGESYVGLEHTMRGRAEVYVKEGTVAAGQVRVADATVWAIVEIFKDRLDLSDSARREAFQQAVFGRVFAAENGFGGGSAGGINSSPLAFGDVQVPDGDLEMQPSGDAPRDFSDSAATYLKPPGGVGGAGAAGEPCCGIVGPHQHASVAKAIEFLIAEEIAPEFQLIRPFVGNRPGAEAEGWVSLTGEEILEFGQQRGQFPNSIESQIYDEILSYARNIERPLRLPASEIHDLIFSTKSGSIALQYVARRLVVRLGVDTETEASDWILIPNAVHEKRKRSN